MPQVTPPWLGHPPGVWAERAQADGASVLVDFGGETTLSLRAWLRDRDGLAAALGPTTRLRVDDRDVDVAVPTEEASPAVYRARVAAGEAVVELTLTDASDLGPEAALAVVEQALAVVDYAWIAARARPPAQLTPSADRLVPWPVHPTHPMAAELSCRTLPNGLHMGVAAVEPPWASVLVADHPLRTAIAADRLLDVAVVGLVRRMIAGEVPAEKRTARDVDAFVIGPHPLAVACLLLPDLALWARDVLEVPGPLWAVPLDRHLLLVVPERVDLPRDSWAPPLKLLG